MRASGSAGEMEVSWIQIVFSERGRERERERVSERGRERERGRKEGGNTYGRTQSVPKLSLPASHVGSQGHRVSN